MNFETAWGIYNGDKLSVIDYRVHIFWRKHLAEDFCPTGHHVRKVKIEPTEHKPVAVCQHEWRNATVIKCNKCGSEYHD